MDWIEIIGFLAAFCTTISFFPQTIKTIRTKDTKALSLSMYTLFTLGIGMWLVYGLMISNYPIIIANTITFILSSIILIMKIKYK